MKEYLKVHQRKKRQSVMLGVGLTVVLHAAALALVSCTGLKYLWPPEEEQSFLLDFSVEQEELPDIVAKDPVSPEPEPEKKVEVVQKAESPEEAPPMDNATPEAAKDDFGEVETPAPEPEKPKLDARASFPGMSRKDTSKATTPHTSTDPKASFKAGQADGNSAVGVTSGRSRAELEGRTVEGYLIKPKYDSQVSGIVVVKIKVDAYGRVTTAEPGAQGTTVTDRTLWAAARNAALETRFSTAKADSEGNIPPVQEGKITYIFNLK